MGLHCFDVSGGKFEAVGKGFKGGSVDSSSLAGCKDNKWLNLPAASGDGSNERGVLVNFPLCGCFWETVMAVGEFDVVEFDVCGGLCGTWIVGLEAFDEKNVWPKAGWASAWGREAYAKE